MTHNSYSFDIQKDHIIKGKIKMLGSIFKQMIENVKQERNDTNKIRLADTYIESLTDALKKKPMNRLENKFDFTASKLEDVLSDSDTSNYCFYIDGNGIYKTSDLKKMDFLLDMVCKDHLDDNLIKIIRNDKNRRCVFNYTGKNKKKLLQLLKDKYENKFISVDNKIISDIYANDYNEYRNICEEIFHFCMQRKMLESDFDLFKSSYDHISDTFYNAIPFLVNIHNYKDILDNMPINITININSNNGNINGDVNGNNNVCNLNCDNIAETTKSAFDIGKEWIESKNLSEIIIKNIIDDFRNINENMRNKREAHVAKLLKDLGYIKKHKRTGNVWQKPKPSDEV